MSPIGMFQVFISLPPGVLYVLLLFPVKTQFGEKIPKVPNVLVDNDN
jgi:hypothetical protein